MGVAWAIRAQDPGDKADGVGSAACPSIAVTHWPRKVDQTGK